MTMRIRYRADSFADVGWKEIDIDEPADLAVFDGIDWTMVAVHLHTGEQIVIECLERDDD